MLNKPKFCGNRTITQVCSFLCSPPYSFLFSFRSPTLKPLLVLCFFLFLLPCFSCFLSLLFHIFRFFLSFLFYLYTMCASLFHAFLLFPSYICMLYMQLGVMTLTLFPVRLFFAAFMMLLAWPFAFIATVGRNETSVEHQCFWRRSVHVLFSTYTSISTQRRTVPANRLRVSYYVDSSLLLLSHEFPPFFCSLFTFTFLFFFFSFPPFIAF